MDVTPYDLTNQKLRIKESKGMNNVKLGSILTEN